MFDPNIQDYSRRNHENPAPASAHVSQGLLAFMANLLTAFTAVDPRVITRQERRDGRTAPGF
jgi:hypothetical protein